MIGVVLHIKNPDLDLVKLNWGTPVDSETKGVDPNSIRYVLFCVSENLKLAGKVERVVCHPNSATKPYFIEFSDFIIPPANFSVPLGRAPDKLVFINPNCLKEIETSFASPKCEKRPLEVPLHLSIGEAVKALSARYGLLEENIKISLHN
ncbi:hypothetical protein KDL27_06350 [Pseudomonas syringae pv. syringae]|uniref:Uncharacterized protein n=1 Tax=Pseudomonas syringae pv. syringae TaxID=321 RepID=A0AB35JN81_PSESY|nr:hypothetical protein [Pseudomonas syringae]MDC3735399.1 hypothetical protein [Pseudomonas syringae pv. syringae]